MDAQNLDVADIKLEGLEESAGSRSPNGKKPPMRLQGGLAGTWQVMNAADLLRVQYPSLEYLVDGLVPAAGLALLVGRPKLGKSRLALQLAMAVSHGDPFLGFRTKQGKVLMLLYEDTPRRLQHRLRAFGADSRYGDLDLMLDPPPLTGENLSFFGNIVVSRRYSIVIIDTFQRAIVGSDPTDREKLAVFFDGVQRDARNAGVMVLLVDHLNKSFEDHRVMDATMDSTVKWASSDLGLAIYRGQDRKTRLLATGRDLPGDMEYQIVSNGIRWQIVDGLADNERAVLAYVRTTESGATAAEVSAALDLASSSAYHALNRLTEKEKLARSSGSDSDIWTLPEFGGQLGQIDDEALASLLEFD